MCWRCDIDNGIPIRREAVQGIKNLVSMGAQAIPEDRLETVISALELLYECEPDLVTRVSGTIPPAREDASSFPLRLIRYQLRLPIGPRKDKLCPH